MERLTERHQHMVAYIGMYTKVPGLECAASMRVPAVRDVMQRLAEYEDTGLTPAEIVAMIKEHQQVNKQVNDLPQISQRTAEALEEIGRQAHGGAGRV